MKGLTIALFAFLFFCVTLASAKASGHPPNLYADDDFTHFAVYNPKVQTPQSVLKLPKSPPQKVSGGDDDDEDFCGPGKSSWPELVGTLGILAVKVIENENSNVNAIIVWPGTPVTPDFRCDRVRVYVTFMGFVSRPPVRG